MPQVALSAQELSCSAGVRGWGRRGWGGVGRVAQSAQRTELLLSSYLAPPPTLLISAGQGACAQNCVGFLLSVIR